MKGTCGHRGPPKNILKLVQGTSKSNNSYHTTPETTYRIYSPNKLSDFCNKLN